MVFDGNTIDFENYTSANLATQSTLWRAQTQTKKLSVFAEEFFRRVAEATGAPIMLRKRELFRLIEQLGAGSIDPEVMLKLDAIQCLLLPANIAALPAPTNSEDVG
jgi:hypothetical protein